MAWADDGVEKAVEMLKRRGIWDDTVFVFVSDHGEELGERGGWLHHQSLYSELVHVPMLWHLPDGLGSSGRTTQSCSLLDVAPTLLDLIGADQELFHGMLGQSLRPVLLDSIETLERPLLVTSNRYAITFVNRYYERPLGKANIAVTDGRYKGIWNLDPKTFELYDLRQDPNETRDLAAEMPKKMRELRDAARRWMNQRKGGMQPRSKAGAEVGGGSRGRDGPRGPREPRTPGLPPPLS